ncbi:MAG: flavodoxin family protein [Mesorhizobium sp.]|nr:MAG: flavodoxin family protein [Mesorhizobium sp.]
MAGLVGKFAGKAPAPRKGMASPRLSEKAFKARYKQQFVDPAFEPLAQSIEQIASIAWQAYADSRKSPITRKAGPAFSDPDYDLSVDWIAAHEAVLQAQRRYEDLTVPPRLLIINGSSRSEHTCPGEMSKSFRLAEIARETIDKETKLAVEILDLSRLASEYGRNIHPCKACFSTAAPLCHWPCSCYPNHSLGQVQDWMNEIYPMWVAAHGVMIISPVNWYQVSSPVKLMMDRLVCADGGNPDPSLTQGKDAAKAKQVELDNPGRSSQCRPLARRSRRRTSGGPFPSDRHRPGRPEAKIGDPDQRSTGPGILHGNRARAWSANVPSISSRSR